MTPFLEVTDLDVAYPPRGWSRRSRCKCPARHRLPARPQRLRQDHAAAGYRRVRAGAARFHPAGRRRTEPARLDPAARTAAHRHDVSGFGAVSPFDRGRQRGLWPARAGKRQERRARVTRAVAAGRAGRVRSTLSAPDFRRPATTGGAGARAGAAAAAAVAGRAVFQPGRDLARGFGAGGAGILLREGIGGLLVSHDQFEAFAFADEIGVLHQGRLLQWDSAYNLYHRPAIALSPISSARACCCRAGWARGG
jgi:hypothetical protein